MFTEKNPKQEKAVSWDNRKLREHIQLENYHDSNQ